MSNSITKRQLEILRFIGDSIDTNTHSPNYEEIAEGTGLASLATVNKHVMTLKKKGFIDSRFNRSRSITVTEQGRKLFGDASAFQRGYDKGYRDALSAAFNQPVLTALRAAPAGEAA